MGNTYTDMSPNVTDAPLKRKPKCLAHKDVSLRSLGAGAQGFVSRDFVLEVPGFGVKGLDCDLYSMWCGVIVALNP